MSLQHFTSCSSASCWWTVPNLGSFARSRVMAARTLRILATAHPEPHACTFSIAALELNFTPTTTSYDHDIAPVHTLLIGTNELLSENHTKTILLNSACRRKAIEVGIDSNWANNCICRERPPTATMGYTLQPPPFYLQEIR